MISKVHDRINSEDKHKGVYYSYITIHIVMYTLSCIFRFHRANWHSLATLRFFHAFSSVVRQMPGYTSQRRGTVRTLPN